MPEFFFNTTSLAASWEPPFPRSRFTPLPVTAAAPAADADRRASQADASVDGSSLANSSAVSSSLSSSSEDRVRSELLAKYPGYGGDEMVELLGKAEYRRRMADDVVEYCDTELKTVFYVDEKAWQADRAALKLQRLFRKKHARPLPPRWFSSAVTYSKSAACLKMEEELSGWAALHRRSEELRHLTDVENVIWQERREKDSLEVFYHDPLDMRWQWKRPELPPAFSRVRAMMAADLKVGEKVCRSVGMSPTRAGRHGERRAGWPCGRIWVM